MPDRAIAVYTPATIERILQEGGIGPLHLNPIRASEHAYVVCIRNAKDRGSWAVNERGPEEHLSAFLVGRISGLESSYSGGGEQYLVRIGEYARVRVRNVWNAVGTPMKYSPLQEYGIDPSTLAWEPDIVQDEVCRRARIENQAVKDLEDLGYEVALTPTRPVA